MKSYDSICCFRSHEESKVKRVCWEITTECNLHCPFCHRYVDDKLRYYDFRRIDETVSVLQKSGIKNVILSGGEPLLHPQFLEIVKKIEESGFDVDVCTNATLMDDELIKDLKNYLMEISVSIDSYEKKRHEQMRGTKGCFDVTVENIKKLVLKGYEVHATTVVDEAFAENITDMVDFLFLLGIRSVAFLGLIPIGTGKNGLFSEDCQAVLKKQISYARDKYPDMAINTKQLLKDTSVCNCGAGSVVFGLGTDGIKLEPCLLTRQRNNKRYDDSLIGMCPGSRYLTQKE